MSKRQWLMILGVLTLTLPFLGFPSNLDTIIFVIIGLVIIAISYRLNSNKVKPENNSSSIPYIEHKSETTTPGSTQMKNENIINNPMNL